MHFNHLYVKWFPIFYFYRNKKGMVFLQQYLCNLHYFLSLAYLSYFLFCSNSSIQWLYCILFLLKLRFPHVLYNFTTKFYGHLYPYFLCKEDLHFHNPYLLNDSLIKKLKKNQKLLNYFLLEFLNRSNPKFQFL